MINEKNKKIEVLAPVGGEEQLVAAVRAGADAVYLGLQNFNARKSAANFDAEEFLNAVKYCNARGVKVYVTLNTLLFDDELEMLVEELKLIASSGVDAVIVQDLAAAAVIKGLAPQLRLHASTQMTVHNVAGAQALKNYGFSRIVLARELSFEEIAEIKDNVDIELEVFVHGALCMSVSGCCYDSSVLGGRSGNRGECAQPCRLNFKAGQRENVLSLKDLSAIKHIDKFLEIGVDSLKIEGRMKRPEYVALSVDSCVKAREGKDYDETSLRSVFSRSGFTDGYLTGKRDLSMFGIRTKEDVVSGTQVLSSISEIYRRERQSVPVKMTLTIDSDAITHLYVTDGKNTAHHSEKNALIPESDALTAEAAQKSLSKTGSTPFYLESLEFHNKSGLFVYPGMLNAMRKTVLEMLLECREGLTQYEIKKDFGVKLQNSIKDENRKIWLRFSSIEQAFSGKNAHKVILPIEEIARKPEIIKRLGEKLIGELPSLIFPENERKIDEMLEKLKNMGLKRIIGDNVCLFMFAEKYCLEAVGGYGLNITNSLSLHEYLELGLSAAVLSFELSSVRIEKFSSAIPSGIIGYGYLPLMKYRNCPLRGENSCGNCTGVGKITDRLGIDFTVKCRERKYSELLNSIPVYIGNKKIENIDFEILYFTKETKAEAETVYYKYCEKSPPFCKCTNGLYFR